MSKQANPVVEAPAAVDPALQIAALEAQLAALKGVQPEYDFAAEKAAAERQGFVTMTVPGLGTAKPALRTDF